MKNEKTDCWKTVGFLYLKQRGEYQGCDDCKAENDSVPAEHFEIVFFDKVRKKLNGKEWNGKRHGRADEKISDFTARHRTRF